jgi:hypothetical protein
MYGTITLSSQQIEGCPVKTRGGINVTKMVWMLLDRTPYTAGLSTLVRR